MFDTLGNALPYITGALFALALLLLAVSLRLFRRSRTDVFWRNRRDASRRGLQLFMTALVLFLASGVACLMTALTIMIEDNQTVAATPIIGLPDTASPTPVDATNTMPATSPTQPNPAETITPEVSPTPAPTIVVVITAAPVNTPPPTLFPTFTPNAPPLTSSVTPHPRASLEITALDDRVSNEGTPIESRTIFTADIDRIYFFVDYRNMDEGVLWKRYLYFEGELIESGDYLWGQDRNGADYFFFGRDGGFEPGDYEIQLVIGDQAIPVSTATFRVLPPAP